MNREDFPLIMAAENQKADCCLDPREVEAVKGLIYFDNAATMQKPRQVIEAVQKFYRYGNANAFRGLYDLSAEATAKVREVREKVASFIGAKSADEVIFTSGTTDGLNMVAKWYAKMSMDDEILISMGEHHSNFLPWVQLSEETGARLRFVDCNEDGTVEMPDYKVLLTPNTKITALNYINNVYGGENCIKDLFKMAHEMHATCILDAAQAPMHKRINVQELGADIMAFSGHKMGGPMGIGVLYAKEEILSDMSPVYVGGGMVERLMLMPDGVFMEMSSAPKKFEAGTLNVEGIIGLGAAIDYLEEVGVEKIQKYVQELTDYAIEQLSKETAEVYGGNNGIISFNIDGVHAHDVAQMLAREGIAVRAGWQCAQPLLRDTGIGPVVRMSLAMYNTKEEIDKMVDVLSGVSEGMGIDV